MQLAQTPVDRAAAGLSLPKPVFAPNEVVSVTFQASETYPGNTYILLMKGDVPHGDFNTLDQNDTAYHRLDGATSGVREFRAPLPEGTYTLRMAAPGDIGELASVPFTVRVDREAASLSLPKDTYAPGEAMPLAFTASATYPARTYLLLMKTDVPHGDFLVLDQHDTAYHRLDGATTGERPFTAPLAEGTYDIRMAETTNNIELASLTFTVAVDRAAASLSLPKPVYAPNETMPLAFTASPTYPARTYLMLMTSDVPHGDFAELDQHDTAYHRLDGAAEGTRDFTAPTVEGTYDLRMAETTNNVELASLTFDVRVDREAASLSLPKDVYAPNEVMPVEFAASATYPARTYLMLMKADVPHGDFMVLDQHDTAYHRLDGATDGTRDFRAPMAEGPYDIRMAETTNNVELASRTVTVAVDTGAASLSLAANWVAPGETFPVAFTASATYPARTFILLMKADVPHGDFAVLDQHDIAYHRLDNATEGSWEFRAPAEPGLYSLRMAETSNNRELVSVPLRVSETRPDDVKPVSARGAGAPSDGSGTDRVADVGDGGDDASPLDPGADPMGYAGIWRNTEGGHPMTLTVDGTRLTGTYVPDDGELDGSIRGSRFDGYWIENGSKQRCDTARNGRHHWGRVMFERDGETLRGTWGYCDDPPTAGWNATFAGPVEEKPDLTIREDLDVSDLIRQLEAIVGEDGR
ncbi:hypothetical protein [Rhodospira trueperi]|uniref:Uncharacterized protein n=1 Tax=Rhodospira trueperi TaxID=69960 RepID=A0A1G7GHY8_9PROT|nr:hypothetical protein [Rhodospira trueperi]SDE87629.1 hypothetical protein SAMN05421720_114104 [Rhodospira trueperi]